MALTPGTLLGVYEVTAQIGEGGMGQVYRARDTKLGRDVALKILPHAFVNDPDRLVRFQREAKTLASLNHPNIGSIYGLEESGGVTALVLELVEGEDLWHRIARGPMPPDEALPLAKQIAEAIEAAHEQGIIHRDLKPANIKIRPDGTVKVLDFGLAKAMDPVSSSAAALANSSTLTSPAAMTAAGTILGTAAYMSPEQARGKPIDKRTDIWAFGCVLYEMLIGRAAFHGETLSDTIAAILEREPDWSALPESTVASIRRLLHRCLDKDPKRRLRDIGDARLEIEAAGTGSAEFPLPVGPATSTWRRVGRLAIAMGIGGLVTGLTVWRLVIAEPPPPAPVRRFAMVLPEGDQFSAGGRQIVAISPDATRVVYVANQRLYVRRMDQLEATPIPGTEEGGVGSHARSPFFSPDGRWIGFWQQGQLKKAPVDGGAAVKVCDAQNPYGASWGADDVIVFAQGDPGQSAIWSIASAGGTPRLLFSLDATKKEVAHGPQMLLEGGAVLLTVRTGPSWDDAQIVVQSLANGARKVVVRAGRDARYVRTGHLLYARRGSLFAVPFDARRLDAIGSEVPLLDGVRQAPDVNAGAAQFSIARDGTLVYVPSVAEERRLVWVDRQGRETVVPTPPRLFRSPRISPDGARVAVDALDQELDLWIWDFSRETLTRLTFDPADDSDPVWTPDGRRLIFGSQREGPPRVFWQSADGTGTVDRLSDNDGLHPSSITPDGSRVVLRTGGAPNNVVVLPVSQGRRVELLIHTPYTERNAEISPDGRWIAYESDESGEIQVYVRPFPDVNEGRWQISTGGGVGPMWARSGRELFYHMPGGGLMAVSVMTQPGFTWGSPSEVIKDSSYLWGFNQRTYDIGLDDQRFLMVKRSAPSSGTASVRINVVENWFEELKRLVPTK